MKKNCITKVSLGSLLCLLILLAGCCINIGSCSRAGYKRTDELQAHLEPGSTVVAETGFGSITVVGADVTDCEVTAEISIQAPSEKEAAEIAEKVKIRLVPAGKTLTIKVDKPRVGNNRSIGVSFDITVPKQTDIVCDTSFGSIKLKDIEGSVKADTSFASIKCENIQGSIDVETSYGQVTCRNIACTELDAKSSFGGIDIVCSPSTPPEINANVGTSYGSIDFETPPGFAGQVDLETSFGSINTDLPITVKGDFGKQRLKGTIGDGTGRLRLKTSFGSIKIK